MNVKEKEQWLISVIVPVYNTSKYLKKCVASLTSQTYHNLEIILVDDGSTDGSGAICDELAEFDSRIVVIHKTNGGPTSAMKSGTFASHGEYLNYIDSDDWVDINMIEEMVNCLQGSNKEIISSDYVIEKDSGEKTYCYQGLRPGIYERTDIESKVIPCLLGYENRRIIMSRCMKLISRQLILDNIHYTDDSVLMGDDMTVLLPTIMDAERIVIMDHKAYYHYLYLTSSVVHRYDAKLFDNIRLLRDVLEKIIRAKFTGKDLYHQLGQLDKEYVFLLMLVLKNEARGNSMGYYKAIMDVCKESNNSYIIKKTHVEIRNKANKLIYFVMKHPNRLTAWFLRMAIIVYYK